MANVEAGEVVRVVSYRDEDKNEVVRVSDVKFYPPNRRMKLRPINGGTLVTAQRVRDGKLRSYYLEHMQMEKVGFREKVRYNLGVTFNNLLALIHSGVEYKEKI